jgi:hypothetical protein
MKLQNSLPDDTCEGLVFQLCHTAALGELHSSHVWTETTDWEPLLNTYSVWVTNQVKQDEADYKEQG